MKKSYFALVAATSLLAATTSFSAQPGAPVVNAFNTYLSTHGLSDRWSDGPLRQVDSPELRAAYGERQFFFTYKGAPLPPGAPMPELIARYKRDVEAYQKHSLRLTVGVDGEQNVLPFQQAKDFNVGLMPVKSEGDVKVATAAILALIGDDKVHPEAISASQVTVSPTRSGWIGKVSQPRAFDGTVVFDSNGTCISATKKLNYVPPMPP